MSSGKGGDKDRRASALESNAGSSAAPLLEKEALGGKTATEVKKEGGAPYNEAGNLSGATLGQGAKTETKGCSSEEGNAGSAGSVKEKAGRKEQSALLKLQTKKATRLASRAANSRAAHKAKSFPLSLPLSTSHRRFHQAPKAKLSPRRLAVMFTLKPQRRTTRSLLLPLPALTTHPPLATSVASC